MEFVAFRLLADSWSGNKRVVIGFRTRWQHNSIKLTIFQFLHIYQNNFTEWYRRYLHKYLDVLIPGLGAVNMATEEMCMGPIMCRTRTGECCSVEFIDGEVLCPFSCNIANRQTDVKKGFSLQEIFQVTFLSTAIFDTFRALLTTSTTPLPRRTISKSTTSTTASRTKAAPTFTSSKLKVLKIFMF